MVKATRGDVARVLLEQPVHSADAAAEVLRAAGYEIELGAGTLDVIYRPTA